MNYVGDFFTDSVVEVDFNTFATTGESTTISDLTLSVNDIKIYKDQSLVERTSMSGVSLNVNHDSITGTHTIVVDLSDNTDVGFYERESDYKIKIVGTSISGLTVNAIVGRFSIENRHMEGQRFNS